MAQLTLELDEKEMLLLRLAARARRIDPGRMTRLQLLQVLTTPAQPPAKMKLGRSGGRSKALNKAIQAGVVKRTVIRLALQRQAVVAAAAAAAINEEAAQTDPTRAKRFAAIMSVHGIWQADPGKPRDGVDYQREMRAEWQ